METNNYNKSSLLLILAANLMKSINLKSRQTCEITIFHPSTDQPFDILFPIWIADEIPYPFFVSWRVLPQRPDEMIVSAILEYFKLDYAEIIEYFNKVTTSEQMIANIFKLILKRIDNEK